MLTISEADFRKMDQFELRWRFSDPDRSDFPAAALDDLRPLQPAAARRVHEERLDLANRPWSSGEGWELAAFYAPLLYFLGRPRQGCALLETSLAFWFTGRPIRSYDFLFRVYNGDEKPRHRCRVTLWHFYDRLGKGLREWRHREAFVAGFHPRRFRVSGVRREHLLANPGHLPAFVLRLQDVRAERTICGVTSGQADLIESAEMVRKRQAATQRRLDESRHRLRPVQDRTDAKLEGLFPELPGLPR